MNLASIATGQNQAKNGDFWIVRPSVAICPSIGITGDRLIDVAGIKSLGIANYSAGVWEHDGLLLNGSNQYASKAVKLSLPLTVVMVVNQTAGGTRRHFLTAPATVGGTSFITTYRENGWLYARDNSDNTAKLYIGETAQQVTFGAAFTGSRRTLYWDTSAITSEVASSNTSFAELYLGCLNYNGSNYYFHDSEIKCCLIYEAELEAKLVKSLIRQLEADSKAPFRRKAGRIFTYSAALTTQQLKDGLLAFFKGDGAGDSAVIDSQTTGYDSDSSACNALGSGPLGYARQFVSADSDYVQWDNTNAAFAKFGSDERTVSIWYRRGSSTSAYYVMGMWTDGSQRGWALIADHANGLVYFQWTSDGTNAHQIAIPITKDDDFHHILFGRVGDTFFIREGTTGARAQQTMASFGAVHDSTGPFSFGCKYNGATPQSFLNGSIAEVGFWDRALTEEEIALLNTPITYGPDWGASETGSEINFSFSVGISETTEIQESALAGFVFACDISESSSYTLSALSGFTFGVGTTVVQVVNFSALSSFAFDQTISISSEFNPLAITQFIPRPTINSAAPSSESVDLDWFSSGKTLTASPNWFESNKEKVETPSWFN